MMNKIVFALMLSLSFLSAFAEDMKIKITVNNQVFSATLQDNSTTQQLIKMLPLQLEMIELNGNEKYHQFSGKSFPTNSSIVKNIHNGDLMLFGNNYLVIFYKDFNQSSYTYTPLGKIDNPKDLAKTLGRGNVKVKIEK
ncbi:MAG: hypothetical protein IJ143_08770 [Neisseriaceae bacterium]|nr:hypothetical protein [Neisseriaceae bacterium]